MSKTPTKLSGSSAFSPQTPNQVPRQLGRGRDGDYQLPQAPRSTTGRSLRGSDSTSSFRSSRPGPLQRNRGVKSAQYDRFIPNRSAMDMESAQFILSQGNNKCLDSTELAYQNMVAKGLGLDPNKRILAFKAEAPVSSKDDLRQTYNHLALKSAASVATKRRILNTPERVLDAPGLADDYYLNLLDWSMGNILAIGLDQSVYMWDASSGDVNGLCQLEGEEYIASIKWTGDGSFLAIGTSEGDVQIWDAESQTKVRTMSGHRARVGVMSWNKHMLSSGCRDGSIWNHDVRIADHKTAELVAHESEVCGLTWRSDGALLASGGNDNLVNVWDVGSNVPKFSKTQHTAAVKALAWSPHEMNLLATGGGSYDKHVHFWNTVTTARLNSIDTGSQVTSIQWSKEYRELVTSHGFPHNHLSIWSYPSLSKVVDIPAHDTRVLHTALSPDGQTLATTSSDESLKFWRLFETLGKKTRSRKASPTYSGASSNASGSANGLDMSRPSYIR